MIIQKIEAEESDYLYTDPSQIPNAGLGLFTAIKLFKEEQIAVFVNLFLIPLLIMENSPKLKVKLD